MIKLLHVQRAIIFLFMMTGMLTGSFSKAEEIEVDVDTLRSLEYIEDDYGLSYLCIIMHNDTNHRYIKKDFPQHCFLETYHDGNSILMDYYINLPQGKINWDEVPMENHLFFTFDFDEISETWKLTYVTDAVTWTAEIIDGQYCFNDYYRPNGRWQWSIQFEDDLLKLDLSKIGFLVELYNYQKPDRPSLKNYDELI